MLASVDVIITDSPNKALLKVASSTTDEEARRSEGRRCACMSAIESIIFLESNVIAVLAVWDIWVVWVVW